MISQAEEYPLRGIKREGERKIAQEMMRLDMSQYDCASAKRKRSSLSPCLTECSFDLFLLGVHHGICVGKNLRTSNNLRFFGDTLNVCVVWCTMLLASPRRSYALAGYSRGRASRRLSCHAILLTTTTGIFDS